MMSKKSRRIESVEIITSDGADFVFYGNECEFDGLGVSCYAVHYKDGSSSAYFPYATVKMILYTYEEVE